MEYSSSRSWESDASSADSSEYSCRCYDEFDASYKNYGSDASFELSSEDSRTDSSQESFQ